MEHATPGLSSADRQRILKAIQDCIDTIDQKTNDPEEFERRLRDQLLQIRAQVDGS
jgi:hypothetical protein